MSKKIIIDELSDLEKNLIDIYGPHGARFGEAIAPAIGGISSGILLHILGNKLSKSRADSTKGIIEAQEAGLEKENAYMPQDLMVMGVAAIPPAVVYADVVNNAKSANKSAKYRDSVKDMNKSVENLYRKQMLDKYDLTEDDLAELVSQLKNDYSETLHKEADAKSEAVKALVMHPDAVNAAVASTGLASYVVARAIAAKGNDARKKHKVYKEILKNYYAQQDSAKDTSLPLSDMELMAIEYANTKPKRDVQRSLPNKPIIEDKEPDTKVDLEAPVTHADVDDKNVQTLLESL